MEILVTGGAGFIGSHLIDRLLNEGHKVTCIDDLSLGRKTNICHHKNNKNFIFIKQDILKSNKLKKVFKKSKFDCVFHLAANSDIQMGAKYTDVDLNKTFMTTYHILDCMKLYKVKQIVFASTSAIYGDIDKTLCEDTGPLFPISFYGAAKLSSEAYISAYIENYGIQAWIFRFPNVIGERSTHGVMYDFIKRLKKNPSELRILGNGKQKKPYLYVKDLVDGILFGWRNASNSLNYFNLGVDSSTTVDEIADIIITQMSLEKVEYRYTGGDRGWIGDVPVFKYDLSKINKLGWKAKYTSTESVKQAVKAQLEKI